ncbi:MAG TPA: energy transducer TonB [Sunxiuqinia sp.]|nr:energy transducer TonB [Sunxiuqinia sp.]
MKRYQTIFSKALQTVSVFMLLMAGSLTASAQHKDMKYDKLENIEDQIESDLANIYDITTTYPDFNYEYVYKDGKLQKVIVTGIDDSKDKDQVAKLIYNYRTEKDQMRNFSNRMGIFYAPDLDAKPEMGYSNFRNKVKSNLTYPDASKNYGVEGTVYVKFIVDRDGDVDYVTADQDINSPFKQRVDQLENAAISAVKSVDAHWYPAMVDGRVVDSWIVLPVKFDFKKDPVLPALIR